MLLLVNFTPAQRWLAGIAESALEDKLGTDVSIDRLEIGLFNRVVLHNVRILDQKGETLLEARQMSAKIEYRALLESRVSLRTVSLLDANINLYRERPDAPTNFDFVVKAFSSKEKKEPSRLNLTLGSVIIRRCHFRWDERWQVRKPHQFTASHIDVRDFNANVSLRCLTPDSINLRLRSLSFTEAAGLDVHSLSFRLAGNRRHCVVTNFSLQLHGSRFDEDHLEASYNVDSAQPFLTTLSVSGRVNRARLSLTDIACFVPRLRDFPYTVECSTAFSVNPEEIDVSTLTLKELEDRVELTAHAKFLRGGGLQAADTRRSGIYRVSGGINRLFIADGAASTLLAPLLTESTQALLNRLGQTTLTATGFVERGQRSQLKVEAQTACGQAYASVHWLGDRLNVQASSTGFDLANLLGHSADGVGQGSSHIPTDIAFQADAEAQLEDKRVTDFTLSTIVERVSYNGQTYRDLRLTASKQGNTLQGELHSGDPALALDGTASTTLSGNTPTSLTADLTFHQFTPATFGLSGKYAAASYSGHLTADLPVLTGKNRRGTLTLSDFHKFSQGATALLPSAVERSGSDGTHGVDEDVATKSYSVADYYLNDLSLTFSPSQRGTHLHLSSDFAVADLDGDLSTSRVKQALESRLQRVLPSLFSASNTQSAMAARRNNSASDDLTFNARLTKSDFFQTMLGLPLDFSDEVLIEGKLSGDAQTSLLASSPFVSYNGVALNNLRLYLRGDGQELTTLVQGAKDFKNTRMKFALSATAKDDVVDSELQWDDGETHRYSGSVSTLTTLSRTLDRQLAVSCNLRPTNISIGDTLWTLGAANVTAVGSNLRVNHVNLSHDRVGDTPQSLTISGELTRQPSDSLKIELRDIDISYILSLANVRPVSFGGQATGTLVAKQASRSDGTLAVDGGVSPLKNSTTKNSLIVAGTLHVPDFTFNGGNMGDADIAVGFNTSDLRINMDARMEEAGVGNTHVVGYVGIAEKGLDLNITGRNTTLRFLRRYLPAMFQDIDGRTTGHCRLHGSFKALDIEGDERVSFYAKMSPLGTGFHLYDGTVTMSSGDDASGRSANFVFTDFKMKDDARGTGTVSGRMLHNHFKKFRYDFYANFSDMLVYDKGRSDDMPFYATAYGTGDVHLYGQPGSFTADINARPTRGTIMTYIVDTHSSSVDVSLLTFGEKSQGATQVGAAVSRPPISSDASRSDGTLAVGEKQAATSGASKLTTNNSTTNNSSSKTDINLNFVIDMQPEADVRIVMDEKTANTITLAGTGALRATYYNKGAFQMFGNFLVDHGLYKLTIQDVIQKNLHFESGGNIVFAGNPFDGELNLKAVYTVPSVSLSDLGLNLSNASVRADCILHMGGKVLSPQITFGLDLPDASEEVKQMVHQFVTTDEDMNRQVLHLLGLGRFYNYNFAATDAALGGQSQTNVAMKSLLASTITSQLNNVLQNAVGTSDWTFGANLTTGQIGWSDMEVAGMLSGSLFSGRLLVNGNFGYRDRALSNTNFVGDFDISYLLTPGGGIRLKAYSETNDRYFSRTALTTQGIGIQFRRDFTNFFDLFRARGRKTKRTTP